MALPIRRLGGWGLLAPCILALSCGGERPSPAPDEAQRLRDEPDPQLVFWDRLEQLCGSAFPTAESAPTTEESLASFDECSMGEIGILIRRAGRQDLRLRLASTSVGLRLEVLGASGFVGETRGRGEPGRQSFYGPLELGGDPTTTTPRWWMEIEPGATLTLSSDGEEDAGRETMVFDLQARVGLEDGGPRR
jgi:hypothetical protein